MMAKGHAVLFEEDPFVTKQRGRRKEDGLAFDGN